MRCLLLTVVFYLTTLSVKPQTAENIIAEIKSINKAVAYKTGGSCNAAAISNRGMNVFLADKTSYLSESSDLSLYTNYVTLNTSEGKFTINHNFQKATGIDAPIKKLFSVGVSTNIANSFSASFLDKKFENELGVTVNYKWLGKTKTYFTRCTKMQNGNKQKLAMDALRASIIHSLIIDINKKETDFKNAIGDIDTVEVPGQQIDTAKLLMQQIFYENLANEYAEKFALLQAEILTQTKNFRLVTTGWTSLTAYLPLAFPKYTVAQSLTSALTENHPYPVEVMLSHSRLWESGKAGRLFFTLGTNIIFSNAKLSYGLNRINLVEYKNLGGTDTLHLASLKNDKAYIGNYETFITPSIKARLVYFFPSSHVGISFLMVQNLGRYSSLHGRLGIPVVLINSKKIPAVNFELYVSFFDMNNTVAPEKKYGNKTSVGLGVGIPFSRLMY